MKLHKKPSVPAARGGSTLVEVLMALLVLSIGVSSLAVMFPLSILRSIQATQLTAATSLRYNVEELIDAFPDMIFNPDNDTNYAEHHDSNYIIDPWGDAVLTPLNGGTPVDFGDVAALQRFGAIFNGNAVAQNIAIDFATSEDNWDTLLDDVVDTASLVNTINTAAVPPEPKIIFPGAFSATGLAGAYQYAAGDPIYRVVFFDVTGKKSHSRVLQEIAADDTLSWDVPLPDLPPNDFVPATARLQVRQPQYSWLITVRRNESRNVVEGAPLGTGLVSESDESADIDIVVFFKRSPENEEPLPAPASQIAENAYDLGGAGFQAGVDNITVQWDSSAGEPEPFIKNGSFVFDPHGAHWYRILSFEELATLPTGESQIQLFLDRGANADSPAPVGGVVEKGAVFLKGIVDVFPIIGKQIHWNDPNVSP